MRNFDLDTTEAVIDALGGNPAVAEITASSTKAVWNWRNAKQFPAWTYLLLTRELKRIGKSAPDTLWAMQPPAPKTRSEVSV